MTEPLEALVVELLRRAEGSRASASALLSDVFRAHELKPRQQKRVKELFHRMLAWRRLIDHALAVATPNGVAPRVAEPLRFLVAQVLAGELGPKAARARIPWVDWQRVAALPEEVRKLPDPVQSLALSASLPDWLARRFHHEFGAAAAGLLHALNQRAPLTLRANTLRCSREELAARLREEGIETRPTRFAAQGLEVVTPAQLFRTAAFRAGWFEMQDEASQLVAEVVAPPPAGAVLDACAGAGGKSLALAALLANQGEILALDADAGRLADLRQRARRAGAHDIRALRVPPDAWPAEVEEFARRADRILVDAPCSGFGALRRNPDARWRMDESDLVRLRATQVALLTRAVRLLRPGARAIYATCTVLRGENEDVVREVLAAEPGLEPVRVVEVLGGERGRPISDPDGCYLRTLPHVHASDGFFAAILRRCR